MNHYGMAELEEFKRLLEESHAEVATWPEWAKFNSAAQEEANAVQHTNGPLAEKTLDWLLRNHLAGSVLQSAVEKRWPKR